jgi:hypothetical protein
MMSNPRILLAILACMVLGTGLYKPAQAQDAPKGSFKTTGGMTVRFPESFTAKELDKNMVLLTGVDSGGMFAMLLQAGKEVALQGVRPLADAATLIEEQIRFGVESGFYKSPEAETATKKIANGSLYSQQLPSTQSTDLMLIMAVDLTDGGLAVATVSTTEARLGSLQPMVEAILTSVRLDGTYGDFVAPEAAIEPPPADAKIAEDGLPYGVALKTTQMPSNTILFLSGARLSYPSTWAYLDEQAKPIEDTVLLGTSNASLLATISIYALNFDSYESWKESLTGWSNNPETAVWEKVELADDRIAEVLRDGNQTFYMLTLSDQYIATIIAIGDSTNEQIRKELTSLVESFVMRDLPQESGTPTPEPTLEATKAP